MEIDLELLPDQDEPVMGDLDRWIELTGKPQEAPDCDMWLLCKNGDIIFSAKGDFVEIGYHTHYMIAQKPLPPPKADPEKNLRQEAEIKAREFMKVYDSFSDSSCRSRLDILTEYILKSDL